MYDNNEAINLIYSCHGAALRTISQDAGKHFTGLSYAARYMTATHRAPSRLLRRLKQLDNAFAVARHITSQSCEELMRELHAACRASSYHGFDHEPVDPWTVGPDPLADTRQRARHVHNSSLHW